jgi:dTDP-4-dehydrorhamnose reductase
MLNAAVPIRIAKLSKDKDIKFIHISTDHFYSDLNFPRSETDHMTPINQYGYAKFFAEKSILSSNPNSLVLRTNFFGHSISGKRSILDFAIAAFLNDQVIYGFEDVVFSPVGVTQFATILPILLEKDISGILNLCGSESLTKFSFLNLVAEEMGSDTSLIHPSISTEHRTKVERPVRLSLNNSRLLGFTGDLPSLKHMIRVELRKRLTHLN